MVINVTGWNDLMAGNIFTASTVLFQSFYGDWYLTLLFLSFKGLLWFSSKSPLLGFIFTVMFLSVFQSVLDPTIVATVMAIAVFELGFVLYSIAFKK